MPFDAKPPHFWPAAEGFVHYQLQFNENAIKSLLKTHEPIFHGHENGDSPFHGVCQAHENSIKYYLT